MKYFKKPLCVLMSISIFTSTTLSPLYASMIVGAYAEDDNLQANSLHTNNIGKDHTSGNNDNDHDNDRIFSSSHQASEATVEEIELDDLRALPRELKEDPSEIAESPREEYKDSKEETISPPSSSESSKNVPTEGPHQQSGSAVPYQHAFLDKLGWKQEDLITAGIDLNTLDQVLAVEMTYRNSLRWTAVENFLGKVFTYPVLDFGGLGHTPDSLQLHPHKGLNSRTWIHGSSLPLQSKWTLQKALSTRAFIEGVEFATLKGLDLVFAFLLGYQVVQPTTKVLDVLRHGSTNSVLGLANQFHQHPQLLAVFTFPILWGIAKSILSLTKIDKVDLETAERLTATLKTQSPPKVTKQLKWIMPFTPNHSALKTLEQWLQWEGRANKTSPQSQQEALKAIQDLAQSSGGLVAGTALSSLYTLAYGLNLRDTPSLRGIYSDKDLLERIALKLKAFETLRDTFPTSPLPRIYQAYSLWSLGQSPSFSKVTLPATAFKAGRTAMQTLSLVAIIKTLLEYLNCSEKPGLSFTGYQPWSSDYTQECFDELVRQFNQIPGQPANTLVDVLDKYHFPDGTYELDLSGKGIEADVIVEILKRFQEKGPTLTGVNLSGNNIFTPEDVTNVMATLPSSLQTFNLSNIFPLISFPSSEWSQILSANLQYFLGLTTLNLADNGIGYTASDGVVSIGQGLQYLPQLTTLDLSHTQMGVTDSNGTIAIGQRLQYLPQLTSLDLSQNKIGVTDALGGISIGKSLPYLQSLKTFNVAFNKIGSTGNTSALAILNPLPQLPNLVTVNLQGIANISWTDGAQALANINNRQLQAVCESQICQGTAITPVKQSSQDQYIQPQTQTSSGPSLQAPWIFGLMHRSVQKLKGFVSGSYDSLLGSIGSNLKEVTTNSPAYFPNIQSPIVYDWQPVEGTIRSFGSESSYTTHLSPAVPSTYAPSYQAIGQ